MKYMVTMLYDGDSVSKGKISSSLTHVTSIRREPMDALEQADVDAIAERMKRDRVTEATLLFIPVAASMFNVDDQYQGFHRRVRVVMPPTAQLEVIS